MLPHIDYDLDVQGDVILTLENPNAPFAVWVDEDGLWEPPRPPPPVLDDPVRRSFRSVDPALQEESQLEDLWGWAGLPQAAPVEQEMPVEDEMPVQEELAEIEEVPEATEGVEAPVDLSNLSVQGTPYVSDPSGGAVSEQTGLEDDGVINNEVSQIRFRLSSRHLISASSYFKAILTGPLKDNTSRAHSSYIDISATGWDQDAFKLLMDIVHGNSQNVPRSVDLELIAKIAVLVDYYKCYDVVKSYSDIWIEGLGYRIEVIEYSEDLVLALCVSCVFFQRDIFRDMTYHAMRQTQGPLQSLGLPIPEGLIEEIERIRENTVGRLIDGFHELLRYLTTRRSCHPQCNAVLAGTLYREMFAQGILSPLPACPFHGFSVAGIVEMARKWDTRYKTGGLNCHHYSSGSTCSIRKFIKPLTKHITNSMKVLELEEYVTNQWANTADCSPAAPSSVT